MTVEQVALGVYLVGALVALVRADAGWGTRVLLATFWPLGPVAFVATVGTMVGVGMIDFPAFGAVVLATAGAAWYLLG